jgi:preprotein translocase subunit SecA
LVSLEDELVKRFVPELARRQVERILRSGTGVADRLAGAAFAYGQFHAQRLAARQRRTVLKYDTWLAESLSFTGSGQF